MGLEQLPDIVMTGLEVLSVTFIFVVGILALAVVVIFILDVTQTRHAIRRNYPVIGRLRYLFEKLGEFFRQYFFAMDREELPFNRSQRSWVYRAAKNLNFFHISGMSYGAISRPAVRALSRGAYMSGCWMNTGEGGLSPYHLEGGADLVFQIGTAKYGVRNLAGELDDDKLRAVASHQQVVMFEIKLSQGAKPGKGGILPAIKVTEEVAAIRGIKPGVVSMSPNRHTDIKSVKGWTPHLKQCELCTISKISNTRLQRLRTPAG